MSVITVVLDINKQIIHAQPIKPLKLICKLQSLTQHGMASILASVGTLSYMPTYDCYVGCIKKATYTTHN